MRILGGLALLAVLVLGWAAPSDAAVITNGDLTVTIRDDNGAIDTVFFGGADFYNPGTPLSDWALQTGTTAGSFAINTTTGVEGISITSVMLAGDVVTATGTYGSIEVTREYWLVPGVDVLRTRTTLSNPGDGSFDLRLVDTFDPDQVPFATNNDLYTLSGVDVARSSVGGLTVIMGGLGSSALSFGCAPTPFGLGVGDGGALNNLFAAPACDPNGALADIGIAIGFLASLGPGGSTSFTFDQAYGESIGEAEDAFEAAAVPEPGTLILLGSGLVGLYARNRRRRSQADRSIR